MTIEVLKDEEFHNQHRSCQEMTTKEKDILKCHKDLRMYREGKGRLRVSLKLLMRKVLSMYSDLSN